MGKRDRRRKRKRGAPAAAGRPRVITNKAAPPPRERLLKGKTIKIGDVEPLADGRELRCVADRERVLVAVFDGDRPCEPTLSLSCPATSLGHGQAFDEGEFSRVKDSYYVNSPWHDGEYTCLVLTIDCLRRGQDHELIVFKDL